MLRWNANLENCCNLNKWVPACDEPAAWRGSKQYPDASLAVANLELLVTEQAVRELRKVLQRIEKRAQVVSLLWGHAPDGSDVGWSVGYFGRDQVPASEIHIISGIEFYVLPDLVKSLEGKTLDFKRGYFRVTPDNR